MFQLTALLRSSGRHELLGILLCLIFGALSGCGIQNPVIDTLRYALPGGRQFVDLQPGIEYLVVEFDGHASVMALGSRRVEGVASLEDVVESWYNGQGEMLVLRNGRIYQSIGMSQELRHQDAHPPRWRELAQSSSKVTWVRQLDRMPGYRFENEEQITTGAIPTPNEKIDGVSPSAQWFMDEVESQTRQARPWRFTQRFAVLNDSVVYSEQCVSETVCLKLRPLGMVVAQKNH